MVTCVVYAHGYVPANQPTGIPEDQLRLGGTYIPDAANFLGYAFATTGYSINGLAVKDGIVDLVDLVQIFRSQHPTLKRALLVGVSEGGLITTLGPELYPNVFAGGLVACGPIGDFRRQVNDVADFRVAFDYFFAGLIPGSPVSISAPLVDSWTTSYYTNTVLPVIHAPGSAISITELLAVANVDFDPNVQATIDEGVSTELFYNRAYSILVRGASILRCGRRDCPVRI